MLCDVQGPVQAELKRDGLLELIGDAFVFEGVSDVLRAYEALPSVRDDDHGDAPATPEPEPAG